MSARALGLLGAVVAACSGEPFATAELERGAAHPQDSGSVQDASGSRFDAADAPAPRPPSPKRDSGPSSADGGAISTGGGAHTRPDGAAEGGIAGHDGGSSSGGSAGSGGSSSGGSGGRPSTCEASACPAGSVFGCCTSEGVCGEWLFPGASECVPDDA